MNKEEKNSNKCPICGRPTHKESKYCIFHASAEEKTEEEFIRKLKKHIKEIKEKDKHYNFERFIFIGDINFKEDLNITFLKNARFVGATFEGNAFFLMATFKGFAFFTGVTFKGDALFGGATFKGDALFGGATFKGDAFFELKYLAGDLTLYEAKVLPGKECSINVNNRERKISFERAYLENTNLDIELVKGALIDFTGALLKNTKIKRSQIENHILQEKKVKYLEAKEIYLLLKNNFHSIGRYDDEAWAYVKERDLEKISKSFYSLLKRYKKNSLFKKIIKRSNLLRRAIVRLKIFNKWLFSKKAIEWFNLSVSDYIYQYGENPLRVIRFAFFVIFLFAIILNTSGIVHSDRNNMIIEFIKESQGNGYALKYLGPILGSFLNCLYFSVVTFTTLGYGDFQPAVGLSRFFASLEAIIGAFTMALFAYTLARRTGGR